ncbi:MAG: transcriptional repressor [Oscillospiraceae bacterium]|nr:transcriptional repressor [Oscillospiraceae bacterium]
MRNTIQRQLILQAMKELDIHASAEQVYQHVVQQHPTISKATVYRNLSQMVEAGELINIGNLDGQTHFDHNCHAHHHFICETCKRIVDVEYDFADVLAKIQGIDGFAISNIAFSGVCSTCKA